MKSLWLRLYTEVLNDPKVQRLPAEVFKTYINLLCLAKDTDQGGDLPKLEDIAFSLRITEEQALLHLEILGEAGLIDDEHTIHGWAQRQYESDGDPTAAERKRRQRENAARVTSRNVTRDVTLDVTDESRVQSQSQSQRDNHTAREDEQESGEDEDEDKPDDDFRLQVFRGLVDSKAFFIPEDEEQFLASWERICEPYIQEQSHDEILAAIANLGTIIAAPAGTYFWDRKISHYNFFRQHLPRFLPGVFRLEDFAPKEKARPKSGNAETGIAIDCPSGSQRHPRFQKPTVEEVRVYCAQRNNKVNPEAFVDFYESKGWMVGKNPMRDWRSAVHTWEHSTASPHQGYSRSKPLPRACAISAHLDMEEA